MTKYYVYSTLSCNNIYRSYKATSDLPVAGDEVLIKGGANIATKNLVTPRGVVTEIDENQLQLLQNDEVFKLHQKNGFIKIEEKLVDAEVVAADMDSRDQSAPLTPEDYTGNEAGAKPVVEKKSRKSKE